MKDKLATLTSALTVLAALPYEKDTLALFPADWTPWIIKISLVATLVLRLWPAAKEDK